MTPHVKKLKRASDFLRRGWTKRMLAHDKDGVECSPTSPDAVAWCMTGAMRASNWPPALSIAAYRYFWSILDIHQSLIHYNDKLCASQIEAVRTMRACEDWLDEEVRAGRIKL